MERSSKSEKKGEKIIKGIRVLKCFRLRFCIKMEAWTRERIYGRLEVSRAVVFFEVFVITLNRKSWHLGFIW